MQKHHPSVWNAELLCRCVQSARIAYRCGAYKPHNGRMSPPHIRVSKHMNVMHTNADMYVCSSSLSLASPNTAVVLGSAVCLPYQILKRVTE